MATQQEEGEKKYDVADTTLKFVERDNEIGLNDSSTRAEMSCGHAVTPNSLTDYCRSLLKEGKAELTCPAVHKVTKKKCGKEWLYKEIRHLALLTDDEMKYFEETLPQLAAARYFEIKVCPSCHTFVERLQLTNLSVRCTICTMKKGQVYEFCWQCLRTWKGHAPRSDKCENEGCINLDLETLTTCPNITLQDVKHLDKSNVQCPAFRSCPTCGLTVGHDTTRCKMLLCPKCMKEFCFLCLKQKAECLKTSGYFEHCTVAEKQTSIPSWKK